MKITITNNDLKNYEKYKENITDYPLYGHTSGLSKLEIVMLGEIMKYQYRDLTQKEKLVISIDIYERTRKDDKK